MRRICLGFFAMAMWLPAAIVSATGAGVQISPSAGSANANAYNDAECGPSSSGADCPIRGWDERQEYMLVTPLTTDAYGSIPSALIASGTVINSHLIFFDPLNPANRIGSFTFDGAILGVMVGDSTLLASDFLGSPSASYPAGVFARRGPESTTDALTAGASGNRLTLRLYASNPGDQVRVITLFEGGTPAEIPEPGAGALLGAGLLGLGMLRRRNRI
jgi:hypothetical protein